MNLAVKIEEQSCSLNIRHDLPHIIKYMGAKRELIHFLYDSISEIFDGETICDLFAGTGIVGGSFANSANIRSNDIQEYSAVLSKTYLVNIDWKTNQHVIDRVLELANRHVKRVKRLYPNLNFIYRDDLDLNEFNAIEELQQNLIYSKFAGIKHHLFIKNYSGTYWSYDQCLWIDAMRVAIENYKELPIYYPLLSSLMYAMAYNAQSTGHYAQYRDANNVASMQDILIYRKREILPFFLSKLEGLKKISHTEFDHQVTSMDYRDCLDSLPERSLIYADPPYAFVHYSRFYHALETLVKYDYPKVNFKGRYRDDRHQSPFCKRTEVEDAFKQLFEKVAIKHSKLVLSYSNTGMISLERICAIARESFGSSYNIYTREVDYNHSTMGRSDEKHKIVKEILIIALPML